MIMRSLSLRRLPFSLKDFPLALVSAFVGIMLLNGVVFCSPFSQTRFITAERHPARTSLSCPAPFRQQGNACVLDNDFVLTQTVELEAHTTINCRGRRLLPTSPGSGTTATTYIPSVPAAAIFVRGAEGVDIRNCVIGEDGLRFDFGIVAINSKNAGKHGHRIHGSEIHARDGGIVILRVDDARINENKITWTHGSGIWLAFDSDRNRITGNSLSSPGLPAATVRLTPGGAFRSDIPTLDNGISITNLLLQTLFNVVINGNLYQFPNSVDGVYPSHEDNIVENNRIALPGISTSKRHAGILIATNAVRTRVQGNLVEQAGTGILSAGLMQAQPVFRAGRCSGDSSRFCASSADCFIPDLDAASLGVCPALIVDLRDFRGRETVIKGNTVVGPINHPDPALRAAISAGNGTLNALMTNNEVLGSGTEAGIAMTGNAIETVTITQNRVSGAAFGLQLQQGVATTFGAKVYLNDFVGSTVRAVGIVGAYGLPTELSWMRVGNHWGHTFPPCFLPADSPLPLIFDSYAACSSVLGP